MGATSSKTVRSKKLKHEDQEKPKELQSVQATMWAVVEESTKMIQILYTYPSFILDVVEKQQDLSDYHFSCLRSVSMALFFPENSCDAVPIQTVAFLKDLLQRLIYGSHQDQDAPFYPTKRLSSDFSQSRKRLFDEQVKVNQMLHLFLLISNSISAPLNNTLIFCLLDSARQCTSIDAVHNTSFMLAFNTILQKMAMFHGPLCWFAMIEQALRHMNVTGEDRLNLISMTWGFGFTEVSKWQRNRTIVENYETEEILLACELSDDINNLLCGVLSLPRYADCPDYSIRSLIEQSINSWKCSIYHLLISHFFPNVRDKLVRKVTVDDHHVAFLVSSLMETPFPCTSSRAAENLHQIMQFLYVQQRVLNRLIHITLQLNVLQLPSSETCFKYRHFSLLGFKDITLRIS